MRCLLLALLLLPCAGAASTFLSAHHAALTSEGSKKLMAIPTVKHDKDPGGDYKPSSPMYEKQQKLAKKEKAAAPAEQPSASKGTEDKFFLSFAGFYYFLSYVIVTLLVALCWIKCGEGPTPEGIHERPPKTNAFTYGLFSLDHCLRGGDHHVDICLCSWCCMPLRIADTWSKNPFPMVKGFWVALVIVATLIGLGPWTGQLSTAVFFFVAIAMRQKIRKQYGMENGNCSTFCQDFWTWFCCPCCAVAQEARQAEFVLKVGDPRPKGSMA